MKPDVRVRCLAGAGGLLLTALAAGTRLGSVETRVFRALNDLPDSLYAPAWLLMQGGALGAAPLAAVVAWHADRPDTAVRMAAGGIGAWALAKVVKHAIRRPRPARLVARTHIRGREASGLGYLSGHAAVSTVLASAFADRAGPSRAVLAVGLVGVVGGARIYVGAHLPLDIAGGICLGVLVDSILRHWTCPGGEARRSGVRKCSESPVR